MEAVQIIASLIGICSVAIGVFNRKKFTRR